MKRVTERVPLHVAATRLRAWGQQRDRTGRLYSSDLHKAATLAGVIWPGVQFGSPQGAGRAAAAVLAKLDCTWTCLRGNWGYDLTTIEPH